MGVLEDLQELRSWGVRFPHRDGDVDIVPIPQGLVEEWVREVGELRGALLLLYTDVSSIHGEILNEAGETVGVWVDVTEDVLRVVERVLNKT